jgi:hypothetical protein
MVDLASDDDGISGDDDSLTMSHFDVTQIMRTCRLTSPSTYLLSHSDQFVYCAAGSLSERVFAPTNFVTWWGIYGGMSYDAPTTLPAQAEFRARWRMNFYNQ